MSSHTTNPFEQRRGTRSYQEIRDAVRDRIGPMAPTMETIRTYHGAGPKRPDLVTVLALCDVYDLQLSDVSPEMADQLDGIRDLLVSRTSWSDSQDLVEHADLVPA